MGPSAMVEVDGKRKPQTKVAGPTPHTRMDGDVNLDDTYAGIRAAHDKRYPPDDAKDSEYNMATNGNYEIAVSTIQGTFAAEDVIDGIVDSEDET